MCVILALILADCGMIRTFVCTMAPYPRAGMIFAATESCKRMEEAAMMFLVELLSGGIFMVYAVDAHENLFLIYRDDQWNWIGMEKCKPCTYDLGGSSFGGGTAI